MKWYLGLKDRNQSSCCSRLILLRHLIDLTDSFWTQLWIKWVLVCVGVTGYIATFFIQVISTYERLPYSTVPNGEGLTPGTPPFSLSVRRCGWSSKCFEALNIEVSHLQFADDALFLGKWSAGNATNLLHLIRCFGDTSWLNINLVKSKLYGIGVSSIEVIWMASKCRCSPGELPFS